jgi:hypothetical protein
MARLSYLSSLASGRVAHRIVREAFFRLQLDQLSLKSGADPESGRFGCAAERAVDAVDEGLSACVESGARSVPTHGVGEGKAVVGVGESDLPTQAGVAEGVFADTDLGLDRGQGLPAGRDRIATGSAGFPLPDTEACCRVDEIVGGGSAQTPGGNPSSSCG